MAWFSSLPGSHARTLAEHRLEAQSEIIGERLYIRPRPENTDPLDVKLRDKILKKVDEIHAAAGKAEDTD